MEVLLTQGRRAEVDIEDYVWLNEFSWHVTCGAAARTFGNKKVYMHRQIMEVFLGRKLEREEIVDHIDRNRLNNKKCNLRVCTKQQNDWNCRFRSGSSKYNGVGWVGDREKWSSRIIMNNKIIFLGYFGREEDAATAYDEAALRLRGEYACLNFPDLWDGT